MVCAGIVGENGRDGRNMACRQADRGPQDWGPDWGVFTHSVNGCVCRRGGPSFLLPSVGALLVCCSLGTYCTGENNDDARASGRFSTTRAVDAHWAFLSLGGNMCVQHLEFTADLLPAVVPRRS